jgi:hypothetical protein
MKTTEIIVSFAKGSMTGIIAFSKKKRFLAGTMRDYFFGQILAYTSMTEA